MSVNESGADWRLRTPGGIPYKLEQRTANFGRDDAAGTELIIIRSANLLLFLNEVFPAPVVVLGSIVYPRPWAFGGLGSLVADDVGVASLAGKPIDPFASDPTADVNTYDRDLRLTITYKTDPQNDQESDQNNPQTFLEISAAASGTFLTIPSRASVWLPRGENEILEPVTEIDVPFHLTESETEWSARWSQIPAEYVTDTLIGRIRDALGKVNEDAVSVLYNSPPETVLFLGFSLRQQFTWRADNSGQPPVEIDFKFLEKHTKDDQDNIVTHNHLYRPGVGYRRMQIAVDGDLHPIYESTDLNALFLP